MEDSHGPMKMRQRVQRSIVTISQWSHTKMSQSAQSEITNCSPFTEPGGLTITSPLRLSSMKSLGSSLRTNAALLPMMMSPGPLLAAARASRELAACSVEPMQPIALGFLSFKSGDHGPST